MHDVIVIGGGPAGLSAALVLARCRRNTLVFDHDQPRNGAAAKLHGFLTRDGTPPRILRELGWADLARYPGIEKREAEVRDVRREPGGFEVRTADGTRARSRLILLATGRADPLPELPGFKEFYGRGVHHCPYCDGWENRDRAVAVFGGGSEAWSLAEELFTWTDHVTLCTHGDSAAPPSGAGPAAARVRVRTERVAALEGDGAGRLHAVRFEGHGPSLECGAVFFATSCPQRSPLPAMLGCRFDHDEAVHCSSHAATGVPGLYVAGNVRGGAHLAITAAAEGAEAAMAMNEALRALDERARV